MTAQTVDLPPSHIESEFQNEEVDLSTGTATVVETEPYEGSGVSLADTLEDLPGLSLRRFGGLGAFTSVAIRGLSADHVSIVLDDLPLASATLGAVDLSLFPAESIERIEVYRGGGPIRFQTPMGGLLRLRSKIPRDRTAIAAHAGFGSSLTRTGHVTATGPAGGFRYLAYAGYQGSAGDFIYFDDRETLYNNADNRRRRRKNNAFDGAGLHLALETEFVAGSTAKLTTRGNWKRQGVPGAGVNETTRSSTEQRDILARLSLADATLWEERLRLGAGLDLLQAQRKFHDPEQETAFLFARRSNLSRASIDGRIELLETLNHETELAPRFSWDSFHQGGAKKNAASYARPIDRQRLQMSVGLEHRADLLEVLRLVPALRFDLLRDSGTGVSGPPSSTELSPRIGTILFFDPCELRSNLGRFHRFPSSFELYGDAVTTAGNPALEPERGLSGDVGARCRFDIHPLRRLAVELNGFGTQADNLIALLPNSQRELIATNLDNAEIWGLESSIQAEVAWIQLGLAYTLSKARDRSGRPDSDGLSLPGLPEHRGDGSLQIGPKWVSLRYEISVSSSLFLDRGHTRPLPTRILHDLYGRMEILDTGVELKLSVRNLTNRIEEKVKLFNGTGRSKVTDFLGYPLPGRSFFVSLIWRKS